MAGPRRPAKAGEPSKPPKPQAPPVPGPPPPYKPAYAALVREASEQGFTISEVGRLLTSKARVWVDLDTVNLWILVYPEFRAAVKLGTQARTDRVERAYFQRAVGYEHLSEEIRVLKDGTVIRVPVMKHIPADPVAANTWLKQFSEKWKKDDSESDGVETRIIFKGGLPDD